MYARGLPRAPIMTFIFRIAKRRSGETAVFACDLEEECHVFTLFSVPARGA